MKTFKFSINVQTIFITLLIIIVGAIIVGVISNNKAMGYYNGQQCPNYENCGGTIYLMEYDGTNHVYMCNACREPLEINPCNFNDYSNPRIFPNNDETHSWYASCTACHGLAPNPYTTGVCVDSNSDNKCDYCHGWTDNTSSSGGGSTGGGSGSGSGDDSGSTGGECTCNGSTSYYEDYRKVDNDTHACYCICNICGGEWYDSDYVHNYSEYEDNGDGTHSSYCEQDCGAEITGTCNFVNGECTECGAEEPCEHTYEKEHDANEHWEECSKCGEEKANSRGIHTAQVTKAGKEPTCEQTGLTEEKSCNSCGRILQQQTTIPATGHNYQSGQCTECGEDEPINEIQITSSTYKIDGGYILDIQPGIKVRDLKSNINTNATKISIYSNDVKVSEDTVLATGMKLQLQNGDLTKTFTIIVKADVNNDGLADFKDLVKINKARLNKITLEEMYFLAADVNEDKNLDLKDLSKINRFRLSKITEL